MQTMTIPRRFRGPPNSGNGGYVCGMLARQIFLQIFDLFFDLPSSVAGGKEDVVWVLVLALPFAFHLVEVG